MWTKFVALAISFQQTGVHGFIARPTSQVRAVLPFSTRRLDQQRFNKYVVATSEATSLTDSVSLLEPSEGGQRLDPKDVAESVRKEHTHILICPGFATSSQDYTEEGSLAPNLIGRGGWNEEQIHVLPVERSDWLGVWPKGLMDKDFMAALVTGAPGRGAPPDRLPYRWYLKRVAQVIREIDESVKKKYGENERAKVILIGHSAGGWLARAAVGYGSEHWKNETKLAPELGIDIDNVLAIVTLGTPNRPPPPGTPDVTGGALKLTNKRFPGSYFEDKLFYVSVAGSGIEGKQSDDLVPTSQDGLAYHSYKSLAGTGRMDGDGIVPTRTAHLRKAHQVNVENINHAAQLVADNVGEAWYGSDVVISEWFGEVLHQLECIQKADKIFPHQPVQEQPEPVVVQEMEDAVQEQPEPVVVQEMEDAVQEQPESVVVQMEEAVQEQPEPVVVQEIEDAVKRNETVSQYFRRRNALRHSGIYSKVKDRKTLERLVFSMEEFSVPLNTKVVTQGDEADSMYFVASGQFECFVENTGEVIAVIGTNEAFGELGVLLNQPRALSVRAATPDAKVYKLSREDIDKYVLGEESSRAASSLKESRRYEDYFEKNAKRAALKACPVFKELGNEDLNRLVTAMQRMEIPSGERIIEEGARGGSMYFVVDGSFACYRESNQKTVVKVCGQGDYFGELGVLFDRPRAVSVRATKPSAVWELHGDAFLDSYRKMTAAKFGAASWVLLLAKLLRTDKWASRVIPNPVRRFLKKVSFKTGNLLNRVDFLDHHFEDRWRGTRAHMNNVLISLAIPFYFLARRASAGSLLSATIMSLGFVGLVVDNLVNASGKYVGEGEKLRWLCKLRSISHGMTIPLLFIPVIEAGMFSGLFPKKASQFAMSAVAAFSLHETLDWLAFDTNDMAVVDNRDSERHSANAVAGTLFYTSGKVLKNVVPVVILNLFMLAMGSVLMKGGVPAGKWLLASGLLTLFSCSIQRPDIQMYGEPTMMGLLWAASASCVP